MSSGYGRFRGDVGQGGAARGVKRLTNACKKGMMEREERL